MTHINASYEAAGEAAGEASGPTIVVHGLSDARAALAVASDLGVPVTLLSAPGAAARIGAEWFRAVTTLLARDFPAADFVAVLDCADKPGLVFGALRIGIRHVRFTGPADVAARLGTAAAALGAVVHGREMPGAAAALDLRSARDPASVCRAWLGSSP